MSEGDNRPPSGLKLKSRLSHCHSLLASKHLIIAIETYEISDFVITVLRFLLLAK